MGLFDTLHAERNGKEVKIQFKVYLGKYRPNQRDVELGVPIEGFPPILYAVDGYSYADTWDDCIIEFRGGAAHRVIWEEDFKTYEWPKQLKPRRNPERNEEIKREYDRRYKAQKDAGNACTAFAEFIRWKMGQFSWARQIFTEGNYSKINGHWQRIRPY